MMEIGSRRRHEQARKQRQLKSMLAPPRHRHHNEDTQEQYGKFHLLSRLLGGHFDLANLQVSLDHAQRKCRTFQTQTHHHFRAAAFRIASVSVSQTASSLLKRKRARRKAAALSGVPTTKGWIPMTTVVASRAGMACASRANSDTQSSHRGSISAGVFIPATSCPMSPIPT